MDLSNLFGGFTILINLVLLALCLKLYTEYWKDRYKKG